MELIVEAEVEAIILNRIDAHTNMNLFHFTSNLDECYFTNDKKKGNQTVTRKSMKIRIENNL